MNGLLCCILFIFSLLSGAYCLDRHLIYVDPINGVSNSTCWNDGVDLPCNSLSLAQKGRTLTPSAIIAILTDLEQPYYPQNSISVTGEDSNPLVEIHSCPPWMFRNENGSCECADIPYHSVKCDSTNLKTYLLDCYCMTYNSEKNETELGLCFFGCNHQVYYELPTKLSDLNKYICGDSKRDSTLCGECKTGHYPPVYSYEMSCMNCTSMKYDWIKYVAAAYIPLTFFYFFVVIFKFSGTYPLMIAFIAICQRLTAPINSRAFYKATELKPSIATIVKVLGSMYGIWNLDFFRAVIPPICLNITPLQALALDYTIALYPLLLVVVTYIFISLHSRGVRIVVWMWKPFHKVFNSIKRKWKVQGSVVNAFATFFLLSYVKILDVSYELLLYTEVYTLNETGDIHVRNVLFYDATVEYFSKKHLPYAITAIIALILVVIMPLLFLIIYPMRWFQKCLNACQVRRQSISIFVNCYQGYYKDGTDGTRDCRYFSVGFFLMQIITYFIYMCTKSVYSYPIVAVAFIIFAMLLIFVQPYKEQFKVYTLIDTFMALTLACVFIMITGGDEADIKAINFSKFSYIAAGIFGFFPFLYVLSVLLWWVFSKKKLGKKCIGKLRWHFQAKIKTTQLDDYMSMPDRLENPMNYAAEGAPLISPQVALKNGSNKHASYGSHNPCLK